MKRWKYALLALCFTATAAACSNDRAPDRDAAARTGSGTPGAAGTSGMDEAGFADRNFVNDMIADNTAEVELGKLAEQKASSTRVKEFGAMMVRDHQKAAAELEKVAQQANVDTSKVDTDDHMDLRDRLAKLSGSEFDREYMKHMVENHEKAVNDTEDKADGSGNDHIKQWAAKALPTLRKHLEEAKQIKESVDRRTTS